MRVMTFESAVESARKAVALRGEDYVYRRRSSTDDHFPVCWYVNADGTEPDCIVGYIMHDHGMSLEDLSTYEGKPSNYIQLETNDSKRNLFLSHLQMLQDDRRPWGRALGLALEWANN